VNELVLPSMRNAVAVVGDEVPELRAWVYEVAACLRLSGLRADDHRFSIQKPVALVGVARATQIFNLK
jgi:hypothetical protein